MIPLPQIGLELLLGLGAALFAANVWVLLRPFVARRTAGPPAPQPYSKARVAFGVIVGALLAIWALASLLVRG